MPSRVWRRSVRAVAAVAIATAGLATPHARAAQAGGEWMRVVEESDAGMVLVLSAPAPVTDGGGWRVPGFDAGGEAGYPIVYENGTAIAVPGPRGARLTILDTVTRELGRGTPPIHPQLRAPSERGDGDAAEREGFGDAVAAARAGIYPAAVVSLANRGRVRGRDVVALRFQPLQYEPDGTARFTESVRVRIDFRDRAAPHLQAAGAEPDPLHVALPNAATAAAWELSHARSAPREARTRGAGGELPAERLRIQIGSRGVHALTYGDLLAAGVPVNQPQFEPRSLRLFFDAWKPIALFADSVPASWQNETLQEAAIWVPGEANGFSSNDPDDRVVFYALGPEGWEDLAGTSADSLAWFANPYQRDQYAWLVWGGEFGRRVAVANAGPTGSETVVTRTWSRAHREEDLNFDDVDDMWYWEAVRDNRPLSQSVLLDLGGESGVAGTVRVKLGFGEPTGGHAVDVRWNSTALGPAQFSQNGRTVGTWFEFPGAVLLPANTLALSIRPNAAPITNFLEADVTWERPLVADGLGVLEWSRRAAGDEVFELRGVGADSVSAWDVTDPLSPRRLTGLVASGTGASTAWRARNVRAAGERAHYWAADQPLRFTSSDLARRTLAPLRARTTAPDMVIVTHATLRDAAERLAQHRRLHWAGGGTPDILVVDVADIYDNFSGGHLDPFAIRNYLKFLYHLDATPRLLYGLLFGDATHDPRRLRPASPLTLVPTVTPGSYGLARDGMLGFSAVDDWIFELDTPRNNAYPFAYPVPDIAHGRITARSPAEAQRIVDKIVAYETTVGHGNWRNRIVMASDDECTPRTCSETYHTANSEWLVRRVPTDLDVIKFYTTEYPTVLGQKPSARAAFIRTWSDGCAVVNYQGHGAPRQLADEVLLLSVDVPQLTNGARAPLFLPISCTVSEFDVPERQSMCEDMLASTVGGAIATIGATKPTFVNTNLVLNERLFDELFRDGSTSVIPMGLVELRAKARSTNVSNETYLLLGDPALPLGLARNRVRFTSGGETLVERQRMSIAAEVVAPDSAATVRTDFNGSADVEVFGTADESGYRSPVPPHVFMPYDLQGPPLYRGTVPVVDGRLSFQFIVPVGARPGTKARLSAYAYGDAGDAKGADPIVTVVANDSIGEPSLGAPRISLRFPNDRTRVKAGTLLTAEIRDENGINIQGTTLRNSIYVDFDGRNEPLNVTAQFRYVAGSDSVGSVSVPLPADLETGPHSATVLANDNLGNQASASIDFEVVDAAVTQLVNVIAFPNPFRDWTRFFFEVTDPAEVELLVFTTSGREVWRERQRIEAGAQASIRWDGVDRREDTLANGTYIYRLRAKPDRPGAPMLEKIGKVVIMR